MKKSKKKPAKKANNKKASAAKTKKKTIKKSSPVRKTAKKTAAKPLAKRSNPVLLRSMTTVNPYLVFNGNCEEAFNFYKSVFGGEFKQVGRFKDMPSIPGQELPESAKERIMHISLPISNETMLMGSDSNPMMGDVSIGQHLSLSISTESKNEADRIFSSLSQGGKITLPIAEMFWGSYFGMLIDKYGFIWMVSYETKNKK